MKVTLANGSVFRYYFKHEESEDIKKGDRFKRRHTKCIIEIEPNSTKLVTGISICSPNDNFVKEIGRKRSLQSALQKLRLSREERRQFWEQYLSR